VHFLRVDRGVGPLHVDARDALAEIGFDRVDAEVEEGVQTAHEPCSCCRVREVHDAHAALPEVPLEHIAVLSIQQIALLRRHFEDRRRLPDVWIRPHADFLAVATLFHPPDLARGIRELVLIEDEVTPLEGLEPEAVEVEDLDGDITLLHALEEAGDGCLVIVGGEGGTEPEAKTPRRDRARLACQDRIFKQDLLGSGAVDDIPLQPLPFNARLNPAAALAPDLEIDALRRVDENAVAARAEPETDVFVGLFRRCASVGIPERDTLANFIEGPEALAETVH